MALKLRRGITAERMDVTPADGELIWDTESQRLYVGDGNTQGGVNVLANSVAEGTGLIFNTLLDAIQFNINDASVYISTQSIYETASTYYEATGSSSTTFKVQNTLGVVPGMLVTTSSGTEIATVQSVSGDGVTITLADPPTQTLDDGEAVIFRSTNWWATLGHVGSRVEELLTNGTQTGVSFEYNALTDSLSLTTTGQVPSYPTNSFPNDPQPGTIVFDETLAVFKGWDGSGWVTFTTA